MKNMSLKVAGLSLTLVLLFSIPALAIDLIIADADGTPDAIVDLQVSAVGFSAVAGLELHIQYDNTYLTAVDLISQNDWLASATTNLSDPGKIHIIWEDFMNPLAMADNTELLTINFMADSGATGTADVGFMLNSELVSESGNPITLSFQNGSISFVPLDVDEFEPGLPRHFSLKQNYPNPFNPATTIEYNLTRPAEVALEIYNVAGQLVDRIDLGYRQAGLHRINYSSERLASGVYSYRLSGVGQSVSRNMILLK